MRRPLAAAVLAATVLAGCGAGDERGDGAPAHAGAGGSPPAPAQDPSPTPGLAGAIVPLGSAAYDGAEHRARSDLEPVELRIDDLAVTSAPVRAVGVDDAGELAVPGPSDVGWYRFGPAPGEPGVAVLVAHVAYDGVDGVFRRLDDLEPGAEVRVRTAGGVDRAYRVTALERYPKDALPAALWAKDGPSRLALVTCGGAFDRTQRRYDSNVVAWAEAA